TVPAGDGKVRPRGTGAQVGARPAHRLLSLRRRRQRPGLRAPWPRREGPGRETRMTALRVLLFAALALAVGPSLAGQPEPKGKVVQAWHVTISPSWFDPSSAPAQITPFGMLYAIHDALVRPYPGQKMGPSLAEKWQESPDGKTYEFTLRPGLKFHNG